MKQACKIVFNINLTFFYYSKSRAEKKTRPGFLTGSQENDQVVIATTVVMVLNILAVMGFYFIGKYNERKWRSALEKKLTHRYQIKENIRTARQLLVVLLATFVAGGYFYSVILYILISSDRSLIPIIMVQVMNLLFAIAANLLPCLLLRTHPNMWHVVKRHMRKCSRVKRTVHERRRIAHRNVAVNEANVYFQQLHASWK
uniref:G_PROTEIN_RECEP_F1_2 domain-containing protein n=1 Tax=Steinernema glaseri TaxID=37863 RepID=A0A1I7YIC8_9BILA